MVWFFRFIAAVVVFTAVSVARAEDGGDRVILRIDGRVGQGKAVDFTRSQLEAIGLKTIRTVTPWYDGAQTFEGVPMDALMASVAASGEKIGLVAINKYRTEIPLSDLSRFNPILALKRGGKYMEIKDKGPLFVVYPFDDQPELRTEMFYGRSAWQVRSMTVE